MIRFAGGVRWGESDAQAMQYKNMQQNHDVGRTAGKWGEDVVNSHVICCKANFFVF